METFPLRLPPGADLKAALDALVIEKGWSAAVVLTGIGSLDLATIRFADRDVATPISGPLEILSLGGTLSAGGSHLHIAVSDGDGRVVGGHLKEGATVRTTAEIVMGILPGWEFCREMDPATGYLELSVNRSRPAD
ncbi:PPC domain-containing DNA-binding protein [Haloferula sp. A504]|uniref:PPC domain-containing DNA-binding protein n=1 Tax=Haloferula sp. A504 TaxID=3373601 RepID=UPI0031CB3D42|nr:DNA-binding protein [Verrucomicrobiaceae bacterium E54]